MAASKHTLASIIMRFALGRDLDGVRRTNATFLRHADRDLTEHGRASRWAHRMHAQRAGIRLAVTAYLAGTVYGLVSDRRVTVYAVGASIIVAMVYASIRAYFKIVNRKHHKRIVSPLFKTIAPIASHPLGDHFGKWLTVPRDMFDNDKAKVKLILQPHWEGAVTHQKQILALMCRRLNLDLEARWYFHEWPPYAEFSRAPSPPGKVTYADFKPYMDKSPAHIIPMGLGSNRQLIAINLDEEAPHVALSVGTGGGKTTMMALFIAFLVRNGVERIDIINTKKAGYAWCAGLPGVYVHNNMASQMEAIRQFKQRMEIRYDEFLLNDTLTFPRQVLIIEEQNSWVKMARRFWDDYRTELDSKERQKVSKKNPAIDDIAIILFMGRQACMNVVSIFQRMSASAAGDGDMRASYGAKILARSDRATWKILVGTTPVPKDCMSVIRGRGVFVLGDEARAIQIAYLTPDEAKAYALSGVATVNETGPGTPVETPAADMYTLREIADSNVIPISYGALRQAKRRDQNFPKTVNGLYSKKAMENWHANRISTVRRAA